MKQSISSCFPHTRMRRWRQTAWSRSLVRETTLLPSDLIYPLFVIEGQNQISAVTHMPGVNRYSIDLLIQEVKQCYDLGIRTVALFPSVDSRKKSQNCEEAWNKDNLVCRAVKAVKDAVPEMGVMLDVALDPYNSDGHDGYLRNGVIDNDRTNEALVKQSLVQCQAGADILGPSDMMDGRISFIRKALEENGFHDTLLMAYAAKYASVFYGPFRNAVQSDQSLTGDKKTYQMDIANSDEAMREIALDLQEGADAVIVKPGTFYLDICYRASITFNCPIFAYQVSGEYAMLRYGIDNGLYPEMETTLESLLSFKRAGCRGVLTYFAKQAAEYLEHHPTGENRGSIR
jgi:porphobilinogen synthase